LGVRVEEQDVAGISRHQATIVSVSEASVSGWDDPSFRKLPDHGPRVVCGVIVDDDEIEPTVALVRENGAQTRAQPPPLVRRDNDHREVMHSTLLPLTCETALGEFRRGLVDTVAGGLAPNPLNEVTDPVRERHARLESEELTRQRRVGETVPDVACSVAARMLSVDLL